MAKLAVLGGKPVAEGGLKTPPWPMVDKSDIKTVEEALKGRRWCRIYPGSWAERFEHEYAKWTGAKYALAVSNGTVTLELSLKAGGVRIGDEVIVPAVTFIATASAVSEVGAIPVFADCDPDTAQISPRSIEESITKRTKAIIVVHYGGYPVDLDSIRSIARKHRLLLVEDCAHAHGTRWRGKHAGTIGDFGSFSFQESKSLASGEGGAVITNNRKLFEEASIIHNIGRVVGKPGYGHFILSSNYRLSEIQAALLLSQIKRLKYQTDYKHRMGEFLAKELSKIGGAEPLPRDSRITKRGYYFFIIKYDPKHFGGAHRDKFLRALNAEGIPAGAAYGVPLYKNYAFRRSQIAKVLPPRIIGKLPDYEKLRLPAAEDFCANRQVTISHCLLLSKRPKVQKIIDAVAKIKENSAELAKI
ncbi:aminotransferase DegT [Candidatus Desantisbacteria bacterium CG_4_10_14_0_8_um_filter_48_22]|uniref:Aminotransferase DegT n=1 Tax=Candidatus Desantisbacteria bacterium CG_4_10_14_0_8_um_filter_48_22 TaxID=1974543 RepID=A0A2M7S7I2_9BACT|nr:MAG: hypothetical protein AUJ67_05795 [Candidatus Desantisbacteria bacterium CG1_02_49_89]PIV55338.1 MAG: aminotransferase DegT [Candidatus Desantisbacteria bacterium CG02_land_8_20_14_3_00_49_13]PIZ15454.1 MAG: aminotransferase DegT [Candidatus Desantisbacteria bacterium CG_4_10_14_0_8_um_filter_48_22]